MRGKYIFSAKVSFCVYINTKNYKAQKYEEQRHKETLEICITNKESMEDIQKIIALYLRQQKGYKVIYEDIVIESIILNRMCV